MTCKFFNIIDYSILGFQHLIYVLECIYIIILYQPGQLVYFPNKFSTISLISILSNERHPFLIGYIQRTLQVMASPRFEIIPFAVYLLPVGNSVSVWVKIILMAVYDLPAGFIVSSLRVSIPPALPQKRPRCGWYGCRHKGLGRFSRSRHGGGSRGPQVYCTLPSAPWSI